MAERYKLEITQSKNLCEACMLVIRQKYEKAIPILKKMYEEIIGNEKKQRAV